MNKNNIIINYVTISYIIKYFLKNISFHQVNNFELCDIILQN